MKIQHQEKEINSQKQGAFFVENEANECLAEMTYFYEDELTINVNHTFVDPSLRGRGIADRLYQSLVSFLCEKNLQLRSSCSYVVAKLEKDK